MHYPASRERLTSRLLLFTAALVLFSGSSLVLGAPEEERLFTTEAPRPGHVMHGQLWASRGKSPKKPPTTVSRTGKEGRNPETTRAGQATSKTSETPPKSRKGGETAATKRGREAHIQWDPGPGFEKEVTLPSGKRADAVNIESREVKELKPDNPRAQKRGERQVEGYRRELEKERGGEWEGKVESYKP
ncbi:hypothetical protein ACN28E_54260 [Archangium lansingense]|uniref:hypothetical protein n=1 Tax=Archangium lansingense TaxID=2995310 RepID=UPI003B7DBBE2